MPQLTVEYTSNLHPFDPANALRALNATLAASGHFDEIDIKSRAVPLETFAVGTADDDRGFVHARLAILDGRTPETKRMLSEALLATLRALCLPSSGAHVQLCVEIRDIDRDCYGKATVAVA